MSLLRSISKVYAQTSSLTKSHSRRYLAIAANSATAGKGDNKSTWSPEAKQAYQDLLARAKEIEQLKSAPKKAVKEIKSNPRVKSAGFKPFEKRSYEEDVDVAREKLAFDEVPSRYAFYLFELYKQDNALEKIEADMKKLLEYIEKNKAFEKLISQTYMSKSQRTKQLETILKNSSFDNKIYFFLDLLVSRNRLTELLNILETLPTVANIIGNDVSTAAVVSAKPLNDSEKEEIYNLVNNQFKPEGGLEIEEHIDPSLKGGYELFYDNKYHLDNSQKSQSEQIMRNLQSAINSYINEKEARDKEEYKRAINAANSNKDGNKRANEQH